MKQYYLKTSVNPSKSIVFNQPWKSGITSMIDSYIENKKEFSTTDVESIDQFIRKCQDEKKFREEIKSSFKKTMKLEKQNQIYHKHLDPKELTKPVDDSETPKIHSNFEHRFVSLRGIFRYNLLTNNATLMIGFSRNKALFGVDYRYFDFEIFSDRKKKTTGCFYLLQYWHRGKAYAKVILVDEKEASKSKKKPIRGVHTSLKNYIIFKDHRYFLDREENSMVFENVIDCKIFRLKQSKKTIELIFLYEDQRTLLLVEISYDDLFNFSLRSKCSEELKDTKLIRIFCNARRKILLGQFHNMAHNGIMLFYFRSPPEKGSFLQFKSINLQKSISNLLKSPTKSELISSNLLFKTEADNHILGFTATLTGFVILSLRNILFLNHKFKLLRSLNLKPLGLGHLVSFFAFGPSVMLNFFRRSFVCSPASPPQPVVSLDPRQGTCLVGVLPDRVIQLHHFTSLMKFEFEINKVFHSQFQSNHLDFKEWYYQDFSQSTHFFSSSKSKFKQMIWTTQVETPSQDLIIFSLMALENFLKEKVFDRFFLKAQALIQSSSVKASKLQFSILSKALNSQNFRKYLNDYFGFVKKRNFILSKVLSPYMKTSSLMYFFKNSHLPEHKFFLIDKFLETDDLILKLQSSGLFLDKQDSTENNLERFLGLYIDLLRELGPRGSLHKENKNIFKNFLDLHFLESNIIKLFAEKKNHDVFKLSNHFRGISKYVILCSK